MDLVLLLMYFTGCRVKIVRFKNSLITQNIATKWNYKTMY